MGKHKNQRKGPQGKARDSEERVVSATHAAFVCVLCTMKNRASTGAPAYLEIEPAAGPEIEPEIEPDAACSGGIGQGIALA